MKKLLLVLSVLSVSFVSYHRARSFDSAKDVQNWTKMSAQEKRDFDFAVKQLNLKDDKISSQFSLGSEAEAEHYVCFCGTVNGSTCFITCNRGGTWYTLGSCPCI
jgi:hypothetical protein